MRPQLCPVRRAISRTVTTNVGDVGKRSPYSLLEAVQISTATMQISLEVPQKIKTRTTT